LEFPEAGQGDVVAGKVLDFEIRGELLALCLLETPKAPGKLHFPSSDYRVSEILTTNRNWMRRLAKKVNKENSDWPQWSANRFRFSLPIVIVQRDCRISLCEMINPTVVSQSETRL
jgi:hypothetical protein